MPTCFKCGTDAIDGEIAVWCKGTWKFFQRLTQVLEGQVEPRHIYCSGCWLVCSINDLDRKRKHPESVTNNQLTPPARHGSGCGNSRGHPDSSNCTARNGACSAAAVRNLLNVQTLSNFATDDCKDSEFELVWEYLDSDRGANAANRNQNWQPMTKAMNDLLEKRWADGWDQSPDSDDTFYVRGTGFDYCIDSRCMLQKNMSTGRIRQIRRVAARADATRKAAEVKQLMQEKEDLIATVAKMKQLFQEKEDLSAKVAKLEQEKKALEASQAGHATQMMAQEAWRVSRQLRAKICIQLNHRDAVFASIQKALLEAWPSHHIGDCLRMNRFSVIGLQQVCNTSIWKDYEYRKEQVRKELEGRHSIPRVTSTLPREVCSWADLDEKINEVLVIHGTTLDKTEQIAAFGFDERLAREKGLYGQGVYFTDQSCKALQYSGASKGKGSGKDPGEGYFIIARVILGHSMEAEGPLQKTKVEPPVDPGDPSKGRFHSVIAQKGVPIDALRRQIHREFVIFNGAHAYPEMIVHFKFS
ncbi:TNKS2 [Symbiodinium sp. CCMP2456]|nr:TNKS2 [Symbiodinium sp. CCMP2456]